ncbi:MFS transporter [Haloactinospora alba]|nr:MFS transporter [Haloactinospora alba]
MSESFLVGGASTKHHSPWVLVAGVGSAVFMAALDASIVTVALPHIEDELHTTTSTAEWVVLGYVLPLIALGIPVGRWLDRVGKRLPMTASGVAFAAASVGAGLAPGIGWLIAARCVQGAFGSVLFALAAPLVTTTVPATVRGRAMSVIATLGALGGVAGPPLGGLLVDTLGWPWIFYVNVPVCLMVSAIALTRVPLRSPDRHWVVETALLGGSAAVIMLALSRAAEVGPQWLSLAAVAVPLLWVWKRSETSRPVLDLLAIPGIGASYTAVTATSASLLLVQFLVPYYLRQELNATAQTVGLTLLAATLAMGLLGPVGGVLADRWGTRRVAVTGTSLLTLGPALLAPLDPEWETPDLAWRLLLVGSGIGLFNAPASLLGTATGSINTARQLGIGLGPALATLIWATFGHTPAGMRATIAAAAVASALVTFAMLRSRAAETDAAAPPQQ